MAVTYWFTEAQAKKVIDRIEPQANGCWWYPAKLNHKGYAATRIGWPTIKHILVHRLSWIYYKGDIPEDMVLDHLCHDPATCAGGVTCEHRRCVNPDHLQLVTPADNSKKTVRIYEYRTECVNGHNFENNIGITSTGRRYCITCNKEQKNESYLRLKDNPIVKARKAKTMREYRARKKANV